MYMRYLLSMFIWVVIARWGYAELTLMAPEAIPAIDSALEVVQIPTHDKWADLEIVKVLKDKELLQAKLDHIANGTSESLDSEKLEGLLERL